MRNMGPYEGSHRLWGFRVDIWPIVVASILKSMTMTRGPSGFRPEARYLYAPNSDLGESWDPMLGEPQNVRVPYKPWSTWTSKMPNIMDPILPVFFFWDIGPLFGALLEVQVDPKAPQ